MLGNIDHIAKLVQPAKVGFFYGDHNMVMMSGYGDDCDCVITGIMKIMMRI